MSLEDQIATLNETMKTLNQSVLALLRASAQRANPITSIEGAEVAANLEKYEEATRVNAGVAAGTTELGKQGVADHITDEPQVTLPELSARLSEIANKYGAVAQDAIKGIVLATGGTQALSQVDPVVLPIIAKKVEAWVAEQPE